MVRLVDDLDSVSVKSSGAGTRLRQVGFEEGRAGEALVPHLPQVCEGREEVVLPPGMRVRHHHGQVRQVQELRAAPIVNLKAFKGWFHGFHRFEWPENHREESLSCWFCLR